MRVKSRKLLKELGHLRMYIFLQIKRDKSEVPRNNHSRKFRKDSE